MVTPLPGSRVRWVRWFAGSRVRWFAGSLVRGFAGSLGLRVRGFAGFAGSLGSLCLRVRWVRGFAGFGGFSGIAGCSGLQGWRDGGLACFGSSLGSRGPLLLLETTHMIIKTMNLL